MTHRTLRERIERRQRIRQWFRYTMQVIGYSLAGTSITMLVWAFLTGLL